MWYPQHTWLQLPASLGWTGQGLEGWGKECPEWGRKGSPSQRGDQDPKVLFFPSQMDPQSLLIPPRLPPRLQRKQVELAVPSNCSLCGPLEPPFILRSPGFSWGPHGPLPCRTIPVFPLLCSIDTPFLSFRRLLACHGHNTDLPLRTQLPPLSETTGVPSGEENKARAGLTWGANKTKFMKYERPETDVDKHQC